MPNIQGAQAQLQLLISGFTYTPNTYARFKQSWESHGRDGAIIISGMNRLIHSTSPYLLQHANNPVDWYPWGEEALARARAENRRVALPPVAFGVLRDLPKYDDDALG